MINLHPTSYDQQVTTTFTRQSDAESIVGTLSKPSKMPGHAYSIQAKRCVTGQKLRHIKGTVCSKCYALKGHYPTSVVQRAMEKRFQSLKHPLWVEAIAFLIDCTTNAYFRWHDSGDLQGVWHLKNIVQVAHRLPYVHFWLPTREYGFVTRYIEQGGTIPDNLTIRLSAQLIDGPAPESLAQRLGVQMSGVTATPEFTCPSHNQGNKCGSCRACWDKSIFNVTYKKH